MRDFGWGAGAALVVAMFAGGAEAQSSSVPPGKLPDTTYRIDPAHTSVVFRVDHMGFSAYTAGFDQVTGTLQLDPSDPASADLEVSIATSSLDLPSPPEGFREEILGPDWLDAASHPEIVFTSESVTQTGERTAEIAGTLTLRGVAAPVTLEATFNGGWADVEWEPGARIGFSATAQLDRSDFGISTGIPAPGSTLGVGDTVSVVIETELTSAPPE